MAAKKGLPAPIDRPLSRAYLRKFGGWSTAFPPGMSEPNSLRVMENMMVHRDGSLGLRPGLKLLTEPLEFAGTNPTIVGTFEPFYLNDGRKAYLFAVREPSLSNRVYFRVAVAAPAHSGQRMQTYAPNDPAIGFDISAWGVGNQPNFSAGTEYVKYLQIDNKILALSDNGEPLIVFYVGATKRVSKPQELTRPAYSTGVSSAPHLFQPQWRWQASVNGEMQSENPAPAVTYNGDTLHSNEPTENIYNLAVFYTYANELGESPASDVGVIRIQRPFGGWRREGMLPVGGPNDAAYPQPNTPPMWEDQSGDTIIAEIPTTDQGGWDIAISQGATHVNFYAFAWSDQDSVPVEAGLIGSHPIGPNLPHWRWGYKLINPWTNFLGTMVPVPTATNRYNSSGPSRAGNGLVASDRMVLVADPTAQAVIRWTTNEMGNYLNFSPTKGGGYKTLTSGNMQVPACVKLWQNPQSADTLTILNMGTDGHSTSYYMAPASVSSQSDNTNVMGFEETTATAGTVAPYGVEVLNNALYHPLEHELTKSTASNYNISHRAQTDLIADQWLKLDRKEWMVSSQLDNRLYYLVYNPARTLRPGCRGNEIWVLDAGQDAGSWSRWLVDGHSLRKIEVDGVSYMTVVRPEGIYALSPFRWYDDVVAEGSSAVSTQYIPWRVETNTQGANRAHDAWAHVRQLTLNVGNFQGTLRYGMRGQDVHGQQIDRFKELRDTRGATGDGLPWDREDHLQVARDLKEWRFYAESVLEDGVVAESKGQLNLVQYRYTPVSVNVGYEYGSVETFEYGRSALPEVQRTTESGVPMPFADPTRP